MVQLTPKYIFSAFIIGVLVTLGINLWPSTTGPQVINPYFYQLEEQAQEGDLIVIDSNNFMSNLFKRIDDCDHSSYKVVVNYARTKLIMVADVDNLSDDEGLYLTEMKGFFADYDQVRISLWRPKILSPRVLQNIENMKQLAAANSIAYDFSYNYKSTKRMACTKLVYYTYGEEVFTKRNFHRFPYYTPLVCDVLLDKYFERKIDFFPFWIKKNN